MPRRRPCCAYCGGPLTRKRGATQYIFHDLPGKPAVGWHSFGRDECYAQDELSKRLCQKTPCAAIAALREIEARGPGRLVANKIWLRLVTSEQAEAVPAVASPTDLRSPTATELRHASDLCVRN
jgi:hypothetical protein